MNSVSSILSVPFLLAIALTFVPLATRSLPARVPFPIMISMLSAFSALKLRIALSSFTVIPLISVSRQILFLFVLTSYAAILSLASRDTLPCPFTNSGAFNSRALIAASMSAANASTLACSSSLSPSTTAANSPVRHAIHKPGSPVPCLAKYANRMPGTWE